MELAWMDQIRPPARELPPQKVKSSAARGLLRIPRAAPSCEQQCGNVTRNNGSEGCGCHGELFGTQDESAGHTTDG
jgi:hypothetical protein